MYHVFDVCYDGGVERLDNDDCVCITALLDWYDDMGLVPNHVIYYPFAHTGLGYEGIGIDDIDDYQKYLDICSEFFPFMRGLQAMQIYYEGYTLDMSEPFFLWLYKLQALRAGAEVRDNLRVFHGLISRGVKPSVAILLCSNYNICGRFLDFSGRWSHAFPDIQWPRQYSPCDGQVEERLSSSIITSEAVLSGAEEYCGITQAMCGEAITTGKMISPGGRVVGPELNYIEREYFPQQGELYACTGT